MATSNPIKIVIIGDGNVGKTTTVRRLSSNEFHKKYIPTMGADVISVNIKTTKDEDIHINFWDTAGQEKFGGLRDAYYSSCDACIILFSLDDKGTYRNVPTWYREIVRACGSELPIVIVGNKSDVREHKVIPTWHTKKNLQYFQVSAKTGENINKPLEWLLSAIKNEQVSIDKIENDN